MGYIRILRRPGMVPLVLAAGIARLPAGVNPLAVLLYVQEQQGSFGIAGLVAGAMALGSAAGGPAQGRLVDRRGLLPLLGFSVAYGLAVLALLVSSADGATPALQLASGFAVGATLPVTSSILRAGWPRLLADRHDLLGTAYALDSMLIELTFVLGPVITAAAVTLDGAGAALVFSGLIGIVGPIAFTVLLLGRRDGRPPAQAHAAGDRRGAFASPAIRMLTVASLPLGCYLGSLDVGLPAYASAIDRPALAGVLLAVLSLASTAAVLVYGLHRPRLTLWDLHLRFSLLLAVAALPLAIFSVPALVAVGVMIAGIPVAPVIASRNQLVREVVPPGADAEAFTWPLTAMICGISIGAAVGGQLVDLWGWRSPILAGSFISAIGAASLFAFGRPEGLGLRR